MKRHPHTILTQCLQSLLLPLVNFCLRRALKFQDFSELAKRTFVQAAEAEMRRKGLAPSYLRLSVMTGLQRREVARILDTHGSLEKVENLTTRVIGRWASDRRFSDARGKPRVLEIEGKDSEFARLVHSVSKELNPYALLFELERLGSVTRVAGGAKLLMPSYESRGNAGESFEMLGEDVEDLVSAVEENVLFDPKNLNLHAKTTYDNIPVEFLPQIRSWLLQLGSKVHREARAYLSQFDKDISEKHRGKAGSARVVLGTFSRTDSLAQGSEQKKKGGLK